MNIIDATITSILTRELPSTPSDEPFKPYGIPMGSSTGCQVFQFIRLNVPKEIEGIPIEYADWNPPIGMEVIMACGNAGEDAIEKYIKRLEASDPESKVTFLGSQHKVRDLNNKWRGYLDYALHIDLPQVGTIVLDAKGMSEKKFAHFQNSASIKDFNEDYYCQITAYTNIMNTNRGGILAFNRSNGKIMVRTFSREESREDFEFYRNNVKTVIDAKSIQDVDPDFTQCDGCDFAHFCSKYFDKPEINGE